MILILDNNEYRRKKYLLSFRLKGYPISAQPLSDASSYEKPFMTIYIKPTKTELERIKNEKTLTVIATQNENQSVPPFATHILLDKEFETNVEKLFWKNFEHENPNKPSTIGFVGIHNSYIAIGGKVIKLTPAELKVAKHFLYHQGKTFFSYDGSSYFRYVSNPEENFAQKIWSINSKCKSLNRPRLIYTSGGAFSLNDEILKLDIKEPDFEDGEEVITFKNK